MGKSKESIDALAVVDWNGQRRVNFEGEIETESLVSEVLAEAIHKLDLPRNVPYAAVLDGRKLNRNESLAEAGIKANDEIMVTPEVSAGSVSCL